MRKRALFISFLIILLTLPIASWAADIPAKVFENGADNDPHAVSRVIVRTIGGFTFKTLLSSTVSGNDGGCVLRNVPLGEEVLVRLLKAGYVTQYDIRSYSDDDVSNGIILWVGSVDNINSLYQSVGEAFDTKKRHIYLHISDEATGEEIEGVQLTVPSGKAFDLGSGEYLIANAEGSSLKIEFQKPGYGFDIKSATIPLFAGGITQYYIKVKIQAVSKPGQYSGYSQEIYTGTAARISKYIYINDVNLAIDIYFPSNDGKTPVSGSFPAILQVTHYKRSGINPVADIDGWTKRGYVVAVLDPRGTGDSFGVRSTDWSREEAYDTREVIEWLARESFCNGKVAMWGVSYMGGLQLMAASTQPPHLVSIIPVVTTLDQFMRSLNGVTLDMSMQGNNTKAQDATTGRPVDADPSGNMMMAALKERSAVDASGNLLPGSIPETGTTLYLDDLWPPKTSFYRDTFIGNITSKWGRTFNANIMPSILTSPITYKDEIKGSGIPIYNVAGWYDQATAQQLAAWKLWGGKLLIGAYTHSMASEPDVKTEHLRWYDYTLKGIQNGIMNEAPISYQTINAPLDASGNIIWRTATKWPLPNQQQTKYYFSAGTTSTVASKNDGGLGTAAPTTANASDNYLVDYSVQFFNGTFQENSRYWTGDMGPNCDSKALTYTTAPLMADLEVTGHPVVHLWTSSTATDGYFFAALEEISVDPSGQFTDPSGKKILSHYVTSGMIRAANRAIQTQSPWTEMGIPYHRCYSVDAKPLTTGQTEELVFDLYPTSYIFRKGNRIRVTITGSLESKYPLPPAMKAMNPTISIYRDATHASYIDFPVIPSGK
jgi:putative CocE/NonD family hydrolase